MASLSKSRVQENALAEAIRTRPEVVAFLLRTTTFPTNGVHPILVRSDDPWMKSRITGSETQIDVLAVFEVNDSGERFALLIENKTAFDDFRNRQPERYQECAIEWAGMQKWGKFSKAACVLVAHPRVFEQHPSEVAKFDFAISHAELWPYIPEFAV